MLLNTLCFLVKGDPITELLLAHKKIGFGAGKVVGVGGTVEEGELPSLAAVREMQEEIGVVIDPTDLCQVAELIFLFPAKPEWHRLVLVYVTDKWRGMPVESREVIPFWAPVEHIPYDQMWADDPYWLPQVLAGKLVHASFSFHPDNESIASQDVRIVASFSENRGTEHL